MFTYFIIMLTSTICGAFLSLIISSSIFIKKSEENKEPPIHRGLVRIQVLERALKEVENEIVLLNDLIENTEKFILSQTEKEREELRFEIELSIEDLKGKLDALGASDSSDDLLEEIIYEIKSRL